MVVDGEEERGLTDMSRLVQTDSGGGEPVSGLCPADIWMIQMKTVDTPTLLMGDFMWWNNILIQDYLNEFLIQQKKV